MTARYKFIDILNKAFSVYEDYLKGQAEPGENVFIAASRPIGGKGVEVPEQNAVDDLQDELKGRSATNEDDEQPAKVGIDNIDKGQVAAGKVQRGEVVSAHPHQVPARADNASPPPIDSIEPVQKHTLDDFSRVGDGRTLNETEIRPVQVQPANAANSTDRVEVVGSDMDVIESKPVQVPDRVDVQETEVVEVSDGVDTVKSRPVQVHNRVDVQEKEVVKAPSLDVQKTEVVKVPNNMDGVESKPVQVPDRVDIQETEVVKASDGVDTVKNKPVQVPDRVDIQETEVVKASDGVDTVKNRSVQVHDRVDIQETEVVKVPDSANAIANKPVDVPDRIDVQEIKKVDVPDNVDVVQSKPVHVPPGRNVDAANTDKVEEVKVPEMGIVKASPTEPVQVKEPPDLNVSSPIGRGPAGFRSSAGHERIAVNIPELVNIEPISIDYNIPLNIQEPPRLDDLQHGTVRPSVPKYYNVAANVPNLNASTIGRSKGGYVPTTVGRYVI
jgi:hypothetical protein